MCWIINSHVFPSQREILEGRREPGPFPVSVPSTVPDPKKKTKPGFLKEYISDI